MGSNDWIVVGMGVGTVFVGLICIILICMLTSFFCNLGGKKSTVSAESTANKPVVAFKAIENRQEILAAVTAVCAEELGTDVSAIRVISFKKL